MGPRGFGVNAWDYSRRVDRRSTLASRNGVGISEGGSRGDHGGKREHERGIGRRGREARLTEEPWLAYDHGPIREVGKA